MKEKTISIHLIKAILSLISLVVLTVQHFVWILADNKSISYIPLGITFFTIFINTIGEKKQKGIKVVSLTATILIFLSGIIVYTVINAGIDINENFNKIYTNIMFGLIGILCLTLSILYIKRIREFK